MGIEDGNDRRCGDHWIGHWLGTADDDSTHSLQLEEVTVTATKRSESLQNVPVAVTALTAGVLERGNAREQPRSNGRPQTI